MIFSAWANLFQASLGIPKLHCILQCRLIPTQYFGNSTTGAFSHPLQCSHLTFGKVGGELSPVQRIPNVRSFISWKTASELAQENDKYLDCFYQKYVRKSERCPSKENMKLS